MKNPQDWVVTSSYLGSWELDLLLFLLRSDRTGLSLYGGGGLSPLLGGPSLSELLLKNPREGQVNYEEKEE